MGIGLAVVSEKNLPFAVGKQLMKVVLHLFAVLAVTDRHGAGVVHGKKSRRSLLYIYAHCIPPHQFSHIIA